MEMEQLRIASVIFVIVGITMAIYHQALGAGFAKLGKHAWKNNPFGMPEELTDEVYDDKKTPRIMLFLGIVIALQGIAFWYLPQLMK